MCDCIHLSARLLRSSLWLIPHLAKSPSRCTSLGKQKRPRSSGLLSDQGKVDLVVHSWFPSGDFKLYHLSRSESLYLHRALQLPWQGDQATSKGKSGIKALSLKFALRSVEICPQTLIYHIRKALSLNPYTIHSIPASLPLLPSMQRPFSLPLISSNLCILQKPNGIPQPF